ncbi:DUF2529 domain-containing protein [Bacillus sp. FJAT-29790]|uniref:DUF2529 domain-containing protein n=1 Tax=Bacillus sp. FJAT-29790 TaxID=1895002 RepID=UPI001C21ED79|nr:DUF2529 domain-containing protein [Bacillus sp. FJAT-29790]MBU8881023.1 DUF2529 domain-containing protein [Bacillus sp. FJAT-29790]
MLKMFSTQLSGLFKRIQDKEELAMEDSARLLSQAAFGSGRIYIFATKEMNAVAYEATESQEPLINASVWTASNQLDDILETDRFLIVSRYSTDAEAIELGKFLSEKSIPFAAISTDNQADDEDSLANLADIHIDLKLTKGLLPDEEGNRFGYPASMAGLFVYYGIKFTIEEILAEYE